MSAKAKAKATATATATTTTTTTTTDLSLAACKGDTNVAERKVIDVLVNAHLELQKAKNNMRANEVAIAEAERALKKAKSEKGFHVYYLGMTRKAVEEASAHVCDSLKLGRQTAFKAGARGAGLYADMAVVRAMSRRFAKEDPDATTEEEEEDDLGYEPSSCAHTLMLLIINMIHFVLSSVLPHHLHRCQPFIEAAIRRASRSTCDNMHSIMSSGGSGSRSIGNSASSIRKNAKSICREDKSIKF